MNLSIRTQQLLGYSIIVLVMGIFTIFTGFSFISETILKETILKVQLDLDSAWLAYNEEKALIQMAVAMAAQNQVIRSLYKKNYTNISATLAQIDLLKKKYQLDFLLLFDKNGANIITERDMPANKKKQWQPEMIRKVMDGNAISGTNVISNKDLAAIDGKLAERTRISIVPTEKARPTNKILEDRGMVLEAAIPLIDASNNVYGIVYGGILLNRKNVLVDKIRNSVFGKEFYKGKPVGTVTIFLWDIRIATNVIASDTTRAIGTLISEVVYNKVLERGERYGKRAFVVNDWYLSAYDPIKDHSGRIIGVLYVGLLEKKYLDYQSDLAMKFLGISLMALIISVGLTFLLANSLRRPIHHLVNATRELSNGKLDFHVEETKGSRETTELASAFNTMARSLKKQNETLHRTSAELEKAYNKADEKNKAYLEMLGFVNHELKSPLASIVFAIGALREEILGELNEKQKETLKSAANSADYLSFTIANYLNLSRIEEGELKLKIRNVFINDEVVAPVMKRLAETVRDKGMLITCYIPSALQLKCDAELLDSVFQNLLSNAIKYGKKGGKIDINIKSHTTNDLLQFNIFNEGPGFTRKEGEILFEKFSRLNTESYNTKSGTGLGLFVTKMIIEKHGGKVWAESEPGKWANFFFTISTTLKINNVQ